MQVRLAFSMATHAEADILLVDEVLAVGDADFQRKCFDYFRQLKKNKKTVVFVTHDMNAVREYCDRAVMIENNKIIDSGSPYKVSASYSRMFMEDSNIDDKTVDSTKRWGDESIKYETISVSKHSIKDEKNITIKLTARAARTVERPVFGFVIKNAAHVQVLGTNTQIKRHVIEKLEAGESIVVEWIIPNIFNDGKYFIDPAIVYKNGSQIADWWEEAANFTVLVEDKTPYIISPPISLVIKQNPQDL